MIDETTASLLAIVLVVAGVLGVSACGDGSDGDALGHANNCVGTCSDPNDLGPADDEDWTSFRNGPRRTGVAHGSAVHHNVEQVWSRADFLVLPYSAAKPSPAVWGEMLYYPADEGTLFAFDRHNGQEVWRTRLIDGGNGIHSSPQVTKSTVMVGTYQGFLHALDRMTGEEIWRYRVGNVIGSSPVFVPEHDAVYVSHEAPRADPLPGAGFVTKNDPWTGEAIWTSAKLEHWPHASVAVDPERKVVVVGANDGVFHGYHTDDGRELWAMDLEPGPEHDPGTADIKTTAALSAERGLAVFGTWDQQLYAVDIATGELAWSLDVGGSIMGSAALDDTHGRVFVGCLGPANRFVAVDLDTGAELWSFDPGGGVMSSPALSGDRTVVVFGAHSANLFALDASTGAEIWRYGADGQITASPALVGDAIYFAAKEGSLFALRTFP